MTVHASINCPFCDKPIQDHRTARDRYPRACTTQVIYQQLADRLPFMQGSRIPDDVQERLLHEARRQAAPTPHTGD